MTVLVVAKAPVPGLAKTRLATAVGPDAAADIAAAALLDTLDAVAAAPVTSRVVALTGDVDAASRAAELRSRLRDFSVIGQRGADFADRLANAHVDAAAAAGPHPVLQIGMDTPQVTAELLTCCAEALQRAPAILGMAADGGWWLLGVRASRMAGVLRGLPMSRADTGVATLKALRGTGLEVTLVDELHDVDTIDDVGVVLGACASGSHFARAARAIGV